MLKMVDPGGGDAWVQSNDDHDQPQHGSSSKSPNQTQGVASIQPSGVYGLIDWFTVWSKSPLPLPLLADVRAHCGKLDVLNQPMLWNPIYRQRLQVFQPRRRALELLAAVPGLHINYLEPCLEWTFNSFDDLSHAADIVGRCLVKPYHRRSQGIRYVGNSSRYFGQRWKHPVVLHDYASKPSKLTGEIWCLRIEWFLSRHRVIREQAKVTTVADLLKFDHREFGQRHLVLAEIDRAHLARLHSNLATGSSRRTALARDITEGEILWRAAGGTTQAVIDAYRPILPVHRCVLRQPIEHLIPATDHCPPYYSCGVISPFSSQPIDLTTNSCFSPSPTDPTDCGMSMRRDR